MKVYINFIGLLKNVTVTGTIKGKQDIKELSRFLEEKALGETNITFIDCNTLPPEIICRLSKLVQNKKCKIYVLKNNLYSYLFGLGIDCIYVHKKSLKRLNNLGKSIIEKDLNDDEVMNFLKEIKKKYGHDYTSYQLGSIKRRLKISMARENISDLASFSQEILKNEESFEQLFLDFSINTTDFFRDPDVYKNIINTIFPEIKNLNHIKIWCAGCSDGKEAYSLAMLLFEADLLYKTHIYATDINPYIIEEAKNGFYPTSTLNKDMISYFKAGGKNNLLDFLECHGRYISVKNFLKENILFFQHNLIGSGVLNEFNLILCRNVLIYFNYNLQKECIKLFYQSLDSNGFLILGKSEGLLQNNGYHYFTSYHDINRIFKRNLYENNVSGDINFAIC